MDYSRTEAAKCLLQQLYIRYEVRPNEGLTAKGGIVPNDLGQDREY